MKVPARPPWRGRLARPCSPELAGRRAVERNRSQGDASPELALWHTKWIPEAHAYVQSTNPHRLAHVVIGHAGTA